NKSCLRATGGRLSLLHTAFGVAFWRPNPVVGGASAERPAVASGYASDRVAVRSPRDKRYSSRKRRLWRQHGQCGKPRCVRQSRRIEQTFLARLVGAASQGQYALEL